MDNLLETLPLVSQPPADLQPCRIENEPLVRGPARRDFLVISAIVCLALALFGIWWVTLPGRWQRPLSYGLVSLVLLVELGVWLARWVPLARMCRPRPLPPPEGLHVAVVTTFVPGHESLPMLEQTLTAMRTIRYPHDTWVLDEGNGDDVRALCLRLGVRHFSRVGHPAWRTPGGRFASGTKHGNYNAWLAAHGEGYDILAAFDTDHVPEADYLDRTLGYFRDPGIGYVQPPPVYYNSSASFVARGAAEETYGYYSCHQMASYALGHPIVVGSHGLHRITALRDVGGYPDHDAEDLYLTIRYRGAGWRGVFVPEILALGTTPVSWRPYLAQQMRWARAVLDLKRRAYRRAAGPIPPVDRALSLFHGAHFLRPLLWLVLLPLLLALVANNAVPVFLRPGRLSVVLLTLALLHTADRFRIRFFLDPDREGGVPWRAALLQYAKWPHLAGALLDALLHRRVPYALTPKVGGGTARYTMAPLHLAIALLLCIAWGAAWFRVGHVDPILTVLTALIAGTSLGLAWSETWHFPPPWSAELLPARRALLSDRLTPPGS